MGQQQMESSKYSQITKKSSPKPPSCASPNPSVVTTSSSSTVSTHSSPLCVQPQYAQYDAMQTVQYLDFQRYHQYYTNYNANAYYPQYANSSYPSIYFQTKQ